MLWADMHSMKHIAIDIILGIIALVILVGGYGYCLR
jgi:hypothetical protein